jgi:hypothetical protein
MKKLAFLISMLTFGSAVMAQSTVENVSYLKIDRQAVVNELPFSEKIIMGAIDEKMGQMGYKGKSTKGFTVYKAVRMAELGTGDYDLYFMADRKSRRNKDNSTLTLMISGGNEAFVTTQTNADLISNAKKYLDSITTMIAAYDLEQQIVEQQDVVTKADKKYNSLIDEGQSLEKKRKNIEKDIEDNKKEQEKQKSDIEKQKLIFETLKGKRKQ